VRVLVTGGAGFIGAAVTRLLSGDGHDVAVTCRPGTAPHRLAGLPESVVVHHVDLTDLDGLGEALGGDPLDLVVHAAGARGHGTGSQSIVAAWRDTVMATVTLLQALELHPPRRLVHVCSSLVYRPSPEPLSESSPLGPETTRGAAKLAAAVAVGQWCAQTDVSGVIVRPFSVYGAGEDPSHVVPTLLRALRADEPFAVVAEESRRDFVHIEDVAQAIALAAEIDAPMATVNLGTGVETSVPDLIAMAEEVTGRTVRRAPAAHPGTPPRRRHWCADRTTAGAMLGWAPTIRLREGLAMLWEGSP
jgi:nucleoside-diphosphate-sugar epimerase